jgi:hypothetical protein
MKIINFSIAIQYNILVDLSKLMKMGSKDRQLINKQGMK